MLQPRHRTAKPKQHGLAFGHGFLRVRSRVNPGKKLQQEVGCVESNQTPMCSVQQLEYRLRKLIVINLMASQKALSD